MTGWYRRVGVVAAVGALTGGVLVGVVGSAAQATPTTYYVDATGGSDANAGTSPATAWRSLAKVSGYAFAAGDTVAFRKGGTWTGTLTLAANGTSAAPITVGSYGDGARPVVTGGSTCVAVEGNWWVVTELTASDCGWAGFEIGRSGAAAGTHGQHDVLDSVRAEHNVAGVSIMDTAGHDAVQWSQLVDNDKMSVNTPGGDDDSGAFGVLLNGDDNLVTRNTISGSFAASDDYTYDGAAVEIYDGDRNTVTYNTTVDNETFTELGHRPGGTASDNMFGYNTVTSTKPRGSFLVTRGADDTNLGPVLGTQAYDNSVYLPQSGYDPATGRGLSEGWVCDSGCAPSILKLRNNVFSVWWKPGYEDGEGADEDNDVYDTSYPETQWQFAGGAHDVRTDDPGWVSKTTPDLHLTAGSPAIGIGVEPDPEYADALRWDLDGTELSGTRDAGAYQHS
ncbi:hypothetical protein [Actinocatenispora rupis]|uniref:Hemolysin n=1 Tax=Actinocatenispora rupis TaxID=519421 RepID=A0A8J3J6L8_9ACTN|nr:hypothetical protein [Actinocatenispora rupis]GID12985.1 hemolysin [Actinocatenispora rupis]